VAAATVGAVAVHLRSWRAAWREPWTRGGDADFYLMLARGLGDHGSYLHNSHMGWPFGQNLADLPHGSDNLHLLVLRVLAVITGGPASAVNVFFIGTFAAVAFTSHLVLRRFGCSRVASGAGAFVYAFAPYHFLRGEGHLLLSGYEMVPVGVLLAFALLDDPAPLLRTDGRRGFDMRSRRTWLVVVAAIALASTGPYYFVFSMMLIVLAGSFHALTVRKWRPILSAALIVGVGVVAFAVNVSPSLLNVLRHGRNTMVAHRSPFETQIYGLKIFQLFVPREGHRIDVLDRAAKRSLGHEDFYTAESGQQLGLLGALSLVMILLVGARRLAGRRGGRSGDDSDELVASRLALLVVSCMLIGASGGISFLVSAAGLREIRAWNRISVVIAFFTVIGLAIAIDRAGRWLRHRYASRPGRARRAPIALAALVVVIAFLDQGGKDAPAYAAIHAQYTSDSAFFALVHDRLGAGAAVFNLPYQPFPEAHLRNGVGEFDEAVGYIYEPTLNWSFGAMRGRVPDYQAVLETQPTVDWMTSVASVGFSGIVLDRLGYTASDLALEESQIGELAGPAIVSADGHYSFYDLRAFATDVRERLGKAGVEARAARTLALHSAPTAP
ncbi:MAG TPA: hypothetical protein VLD86_18070, partial [Ilumatobacteraceae bacterium]|nr:hypothetical protein [Ilumatobacteraceae bacterium]